MNQLLDSKLTEANDEEEKDDATFLWGCVSIFDTEDKGTLKQEEISETNVTNKSQYLLNKDNSILPKIKKFQDNMKKIQKNNTDDKIPELTISSQDPK